MKNAFTLLASTSLMLVLMWIVVRASNIPLRTEHVPLATQRGETLSIARLRTNERVAIVYRSVGCFHHTERLYQINGGDRRQFGAAELRLAQTEPADNLVKNHLLGTVNLTKDEELGLDSYLHFLRRGYEGGCTTTDAILVGYYRDGKKIGEERFIDATGAMSQFHIEKGKVSMSDLNPFPNFPAEVFKEIVPPWLIETRSKKPNDEMAEIAPTAR